MRVNPGMVRGKNGSNGETVMSPVPNEEQLADDLEGLRGSKIWKLA